MPSGLSTDEQVAYAYRHGWLAECNDAMARMYGYSRAEEIVGARLPDLLIETDPANTAFIGAFMESGFRLEDVESHEKDRHGGDKYFVNSLVGIVEDGQLVGAWGTQRDVTGQHLADGVRDDVKARLTALTEASGELLQALEAGALPASIVRVARTLIATDATSVWLLRNGQWSVAAQTGLSERYSTEAIAVGTPADFDRPVQVPDVEALPMLSERRESYRREGIRSMLIVPLKIGGSNTGTIVFYQRQPRIFSDADTHVATALANVAASALHISHLYEERAATAQRAMFLARAGGLLSDALDVKATLAHVATLAVPHVADWVAVHLMRPDGVIEPLVVAHVNPEKMQWAEQLQRQYPADQTGRAGVSRVIRTGEPQMIPEVTPAMIEAGARDAEHLRVLESMEIRSVLIVPMTTRGRTIGAITLISTSESGRTFGDADLLLAQQLASRAATAIDNARLYEEAQEANRLKDEFFATLSHELRTPINAVLGWTQLLRDGILGPPGRARAIEAITRNARAQARLLTDILEMSRIVSGKLDLRVEPVDIGELAAELVESLRPTFDGRRLLVRESLAPGVVVQADRGRLQQVLLNLLSNAAKFTSEGGNVAISVAARDGAAEIQVRDDGKGIPAEFMPYLFERFRQADSSATREHGGLGIGLAVTRHIVELHAGTITAASDGEGKGALFTVRVPLTAPSQARADG
jgi:PAS domain S-box-containing protein